MISQNPRIVLQAPVDDEIVWLVLESPLEVIETSILNDVRSTLRKAEMAAASGLIAAGFVGYEAAPAFDTALRVRKPTGQPLVWFGIFERATTLDISEFSWDRTEPLDWRPTWSETDHAGAVAAIRDFIARGDTYQVNLTTRLTAPMKGDSWSLFSSLCRGQRARCCAYIATGDWTLCSASPELFFRLEGDRLWSRPMKGTAPRGRSSEEDKQRAAWLRSSPKNQAENVMIVDMLRNDLGRVARPGTVRVTDLWSLEKYPSLFQLTSTVEARSDASVDEIFGALFPCASVTGAPKVRAMEIIEELETTPRGAYTGAIGLIGPGRRARFNVGIRTVQIDQRRGSAEYGTGGGIVWDSIASEEWRECRTKALVLQSPAPRFELLETLLWEPDGGYLLLDRHLDRLLRSAEYFDIPLDRQRAENPLLELATDFSRHPRRIRLLVDADGDCRVEAKQLDDLQRSWRLALATDPITSSDLFLYHKTTNRLVHDRHRRAFPYHDDVLLWNENGELTESTVANVVVRQSGALVTPPVDCGLLAGTFRAELLAREEIVERRILVADLSPEDEVFLINSVRRWISARLDSHPSARKG